MLARQRLPTRLFQTLLRVEKSEMFRQKTVIFLALTAIMAVVIACGGSSSDPTAVPSTSTPVPTATPVPVAPIEIDPIADPVGFLSALPADEATCASDAVGGRERVLAMLEGELGSQRLTAAEAAAVDACLSDETVQAVFVGQLAREAGTLSDDTIVCIGEQIGGMSAAGLFLEEPATDVVISSLKGVFCLTHDERSAVSSSASSYGFGELGGIDAIECVVNGVGPTGLEDLMGIAAADAMDFEALGELFPLMIECGAIEDEQFEELGVSADEIGCVLSELGEDGMSIFDPTAAEPDFADITAIFSVMEKCGVELEDLLEGELPIDPGALIDPDVLPTVEVELELPDDISDVELLFTEEQIICLSGEMGEDEIANLLAGGAPDLSLFAALSTCEVDLSTLLGG
jgi:hypothetical protein